MAKNKSVYEILESDSSKAAIDYGYSHRYGLYVDEIVEIARAREFEFSRGIGDAIMDAYHLGLLRGMQCEMNRQTRKKAEKKKKANQKLN